MSSLFNKKQQNIARQYGKIKAKATEHGELLADSVLNSLSPETLKDSFEIINSKGHDHEKNKVKPIQSSYSKGNKLDADQLIVLNDVFVAVTNREENNGDEYHE